MNSRLLINRLRRHLRDHGWKVTLSRTIKTLLRPWYEARDYRIYCLDLRRYQPSPLPHSGLTYRFLTTGDSATIEQIERMEDWLAGAILTRLSNGSICLAAMDGEQVAGFNLISFGRISIPAIGWTHRFRPDSAWGEQITTAPGYRRRGVALALRYRIFAELKRRNLKRFYGGAFTFNRPSLSLARKAGLKEIATMCYRKRFRTDHLRCCRVRNAR